MLKKLTAMHFIALFSLVAAPFYAVGNSENKPKTDFEKIVDRCLSSFGSRQERQPSPVLPPANFTNIIKSLFAANPLESPVFSQAELCQLAFSAQSDLFLSLLFDIMSMATIDKANLIEGAAGQKGAHLISYVFGKRLKTTSGLTSAVKQITNPTTNVDDIYNTQHIVTAINKEQKVTRQLTAVLEKIKLHETAFYSYFDSKNFIDTSFLEKVYWSLPLLNNNTLSLELGTQLNHARNGFIFSAWELIVTATLAGVAHDEIRTYERVHKTKLPYFKELVKGTGCAAYDMFKTIINHPLETATPVGIFLGLSTLYKIIATSDFKVNNNIRKLLQTQLIGTAAYINGAKELYKIISKNPEIADNFPGLKALKALVKPSEKHSEEFNELVALLSTNTFIGEASCFSLNGRVLRAHKLMSNESVRREFAEIISAVGAIDVYNALAQQIAATADQSVKYSFVTFDTQSTKPYIKGTGLWNPFVTQKKAVTNDIDCGFDLARNIVLSGPNTGGKSTFAKTVLLNAILAQTFGIVAAENMTMTPFSNLDCYMNMVDDIAGGISGLKAEVLRAKELLERIRNTKGFSFVLLDEIFTATSPDQAEKLAVDFISQLSQIDNVMFIDAAHFEGLIQFAQESASCRNCHMGAIVDETGRVTRYTYKISEGRSTVKNAAQVAEDSFIKF